MPSNYCNILRQVIEHEIGKENPGIEEIILAVQKRYADKSGEFWNQAGEDFHTHRILHEWQWGLNSLKDQPERVLMFIHNSVITK